LLFFGSLFFCLRVFDYYILKHISQETIYRSLILVYLGMNISIIFILFPFINQKLVLGILFLFLNYGQIFLLKHTAFYNNIYIALFFGVNTTLMTMFGGMLVFSFFKVPSISLIFAISGLYSFHKLDLISQKYVQRFLFIFNGTIYGLITFQIGMWLFSSLSWSVALLLMAIIIYIFTEFEIQYSFLPLYRSSIHKFRFFEWLFVIISSWLVIVRDIGFYFSVLNASIIALWFTLNFMYLSFLQKTDNNFQFTKNKFSNLPSGYSISRDTYSSRMQFLGILSYVEILTIFTCICSKFLSYSLQDDVVLLLMKLKVILLCLFGFGFGMIYLDRKNFHWIKNTIQNKIHRILLKSTHFVGSFFLGTAVFIASTETTSSPQIRAMENAILMRAIARALIWGVIPLSIGLHFFYNDRILDIIMYFLFSIATIIFFMSFNSLFVIHSGILLSIVFLFLFHHKKIIMISKKAILAVFGIFSTLFTSIWQRLKSFGIWMKERLIFAEKWIEGQVEKIIQTLTKIYQFIFQMIKSIKVWIRDHGKILTFLAAGIAGILSYFYLENLALSFLLIMLIPVRYSPEYKSIKNANVFFYKMVYRAAIYACVVMIGNEYVPKVDWSASLYALIFFGYIIWIVRASEEIYGLSLYWRFLSSVAAIIDSGFMLYYVFF